MQNQLSAQKTNLQEYIDKIKSLEEEMKKTEDLFSQSQQQLEKTTKNLNWTIQDRDETKEIVKKQVEAEDVLYTQASTLLGTVEETVTDTGYLHTSLNRKKDLHAQNIQSSQSFKFNTQQKLSSLNQMFIERSTLQSEFTENVNKRLGM